MAGPQEVALAVVAAGEWHMVLAAAVAQEVAAAVAKEEVALAVVAAVAQVVVIQKCWQLDQSPQVG